MTTKQPDPNKRSIRRITLPNIEQGVRARSRLVREQAKVAWAKSCLEAARLGDAKTMRAFLDMGTAVNAIDARTGGTALHHVAACNGTAAFEALLAAGGIDFLARDRFGRLAFELCEDQALADRMLQHHAEQAQREGVRLRFRP